MSGFYQNKMSKVMWESDPSGLDLLFQILWFRFLSPPLLVGTTFMVVITHSCFTSGNLSQWFSFNVTSTVWSCVLPVL